MNDVVDQYRIEKEPYYRAVGDEVTLFEAAYAARMPMMLKGPTGCGKTRFVEHMAWRLRRPLVTVACNEDMTASDLVGASCWTRRERVGRMGHWRLPLDTGQFAIWMKWSKRVRTRRWSSIR